jgi:hypothetical protein
MQRHTFDISQTFLPTPPPPALTHTPQLHVADGIGQLGPTECENILNYGYG